MLRERVYSLDRFTASISRGRMKDAANEAFAEKIPTSDQMKFLERAEKQGLIKIKNLESGTMKLFDTNAKATLENLFDFQDEVDEFNFKRFVEDAVEGLLNDAVRQRMCVREVEQDGIAFIEFFRVFIVCRWKRSLWEKLTSWFVQPQPFWRQDPVREYTVEWQKGLILVV
jgi:hypothetical protein